MLVQRSSLEYFVRDREVSEIALARRLQLRLPKISRGQQWLLLPTRHPLHVVRSSQLPPSSSLTLSPRPRATRSRAATRATRGPPDSNRPHPPKEEDGKMCRHYQITVGPVPPLQLESHPAHAPPQYTCLHLAPIETTLCSLEQNTRSQTHQGSCMRGIELHDQRAPHKCKACRNYDRDRWRRGWPPRPLPVLRPGRPPPSDAENAMCDSENETEELEGFRGRRVRLRVRPADRAAGRAEGSGGARGSGPSSGPGVPAPSAESCAAANHDLPRRARSRNSSPGSIAAEIEQIAKELDAFQWSPSGKVRGKSQSRSPRRSSSLGRWGGFGGLKLEGSAAMPAPGGLSTCRGSSRGASYRGADMEMGGRRVGLDMGDDKGGGSGGGSGRLAERWLRLDLGLGDEERRVDLDGEGAGSSRDASPSSREAGGLGLGFGFGGFDMDRGGSISAESEDTEGCRRRRPRSHSVSSQVTVEKDPAADAGDESRHDEGDVLEKSLGGTGGEDSTSRTTGVSSRRITAAAQNHQDSGEEGENSQQSVTAGFLDS
ncbi:unnamed protein product [Diplocarpon coronariae]